MIKLRFVEFVLLIDKGGFSTSPIWHRIITDLRESIDAVKWPPGSAKFELFPDRGRGRGQGNGVTPIKTMFQSNLHKRGWQLERKLDIATHKSPGKIDAVLKTDGKYFAVEWETGNISSSHRALDKMAVGLMANKLIGGVLVLPTREMYQYLTDRVGNFAEIEPYLVLWKSLDVEEGILGIMKVEHDGISRDVPRIPKGTDGRALV
jgi:hypothetical protein